MCLRTPLSALFIWCRGFNERAERVVSERSERAKSKFRRRSLFTQLFGLQTKIFRTEVEIWHDSFASLTFSPSARKARRVTHPFGRYA
jgi:hypothetical protein